MMGMDSTINLTKTVCDLLNTFWAAFTNDNDISLFQVIIDIQTLNNTVREGANKRGNSSRLTQSFHFFMFEPIFSPVNALNQPI